jgi:hypothetical protein
LVQLDPKPQLKGFPGALLLLGDLGVGLSAATLILGLVWGFVIEGLGFIIEGLGFGVYFRGFRV